jgi:hypothetical protein
VCPPDEEPVEGCQEVIGALYVGHVSTIGDEGERTFPEADDRLSCVRLREHPVARPPNDERRDLKRSQSVHQHLALASRAHQGAEHAQVGFQVTRRLG